MKRLPRYARTDAELVEFAFRLEALQIQMNNLIDRIGASPHPMSVAAAADLRDQCVAESWPTHVIHEYLEQPAAWETGDWGIRKMKGSQP